MFLGCTYSEFTSYRSARPDLCIVGTLGEVLVIFEFKNELVTISSEPNFPVIGCYIHCQASRARQRAPTLLFTCIGCSHLQVFGAAWNKGDLCVDPLCQPLSLLHVPYDPTCGFQKLARVLCAADAVVKELRHQYSLADSEQRKSGPYFTNFANYEITYKNTMKKPCLFAATLSGNGVCKEVVVKFTLHHYGIAVHKFLASKAQAPIVFHYEPLPGNCGDGEA